VRPILVGVSLKHPAARRHPEAGRGRFEQFAQRASYFSSSPAFFGICAVLVLGWLGGYVLGAGSAYKQATGSALTATTLLLVALLKNAELRAEHAIQQKLDALATAMLERIRNEGEDADSMLESAIRADERV
jgi:low affinity Fe/Cu permease